MVTFPFCMARGVGSNVTTMVSRVRALVVMFIGEPGAAETAAIMLWIMTSGLPSNPATLGTSQSVLMIRGGGHTSGVDFKG